MPAIKRSRTNSTVRGSQSNCPTPAGGASVVSAAGAASSMSAAGAASSIVYEARMAAGATKSEIWTTVNVEQKRGTIRVVYPTNVFGPLTHMGVDGAFGKVFMTSRLRDNTPMVFKMQPLDANADCEACLREINVLSHFANPQLRHPNIIPIVRSWEAEDALYTVLPKLDCSLHTLLNERPLEPVERSLVLSQIISGVRHLHHYGVVHRDLKPENVVLDRDLRKLYLIDFGACRARNDSAKFTKGKFVSTYSYRAPEVEDGTFTPAADMWALGCTLARMITGDTLFDGKESALAKEQLRVAERIRDEVSPKATEYERMLLGALLALDPSNRMSSDDLYDLHMEQMEALAREHGVRGGAAGGWFMGRVSRREPPTSLRYHELTYEYDHLPSMRRALTVALQHVVANTRAPVS
eukprot:PhM_4_TR9394/c0_g1_i1/m.65224